MPHPLRLSLASWLITASLLQAAFPTLHLKPVVLDQIHSPTNITHASDGSGRIFVCDQPGKVFVIVGGMMLPTPFLDLTSTGLDVIFPATTGYSERGLLGMAFHPDFADSMQPGYRKFYVYYSAPSPNAPGSTADPVDHQSVISEFSVQAGSPNSADPASERVLLTFDQPQGNHNGGQLEFGPDGFLYIGSGDGGSSNDNNFGHTGGSSSRPLDNLGNSLDLTNLLGKILRVDPLGNNGIGGEYGIPESNPMVGQGGGVREEIYAYGLRNPWRFSFDVGPGGTNRLFCGDVGQGKVEEVNLVTAGGNYGWRYKEGSIVAFPQMVGSGNAPASSIDPIAEYAHNGITVGTPALPELGSSITGGLVYRGSEVPALVGKYIFADWGLFNQSQFGRIMGLEETSPLSGNFTLTEAIPLTESNPIAGRFILTLGRDEDGEIYIGTKENFGVLQLTDGLPAGGIYKIDPVTSSQITLAPVRDNSLFAENENSNGTGVALFAGYAALTSDPTNGMSRRALLEFDVSTIPSNAVISSASLEMTVTRAPPTVGPQPFSLHRLTSDWGEGASNAGLPGGTGAPPAAGDATWNFSFFDSTGWTSPGGDFIGPASATTLVDTGGSPTWQSAQLTEDVESWVSGSVPNHGWIVIGDETTQSARRFSSREESTSTARPKLTLTYDVPPGPTPFEEFINTHYPTALVGEFIAPDEDGDSIPLQIELAYGFSPLVYNAPEDTDFTTATAPAGGGSTTLTLTFRRNPEATDLTYNLQISGTLAGWTTVATSTGGNVATGDNGGVVTSDAEIGGEAPIRLVTVEVTLPPGTTAQFARLQTLR